MATQGVLSPADLPTGRLKVAWDKDIHDLDIDKTPLLKLMDEIGKQEVGRMEFKMLVEERRADWGGIVNYSDGSAHALITGNWSAGAQTGGIINVTAGEGWMYSEGDIVKIPSDLDGSAGNINLVVVERSTDAISVITMDNTETYDMSAGVTGTNKIINLSNTFELGTGKGTIKSKQPTEQSNYIQIVQDPYGVVETMLHVDYEVGPPEFDRQGNKIAIQHAFHLEKISFLGQKHVETTGYMNSLRAQYFTGGMEEHIVSNISSQADLTRAEFDSWIIGSIYYAENPILFLPELIHEGLSWWLGQTVETKQDETTLGIAVSTYKTAYGNLVKAIPHREFLKNYYSGRAFCIDLSDIGYRFLKGEDTHQEIDIQDPDLKQKINEFRTWFGLYRGNEKRHGMLSDVVTISA